MILRRVPPVEGGMQIGGERMFAANENSRLDQLSELRSRNYSKMDDKKMRDVSHEFESLFVNMLFKSMRSTVQKTEWLSGGMQQDIFEDMLYNEYARDFSKQGGIGLGDMVYRQLSEQAKTKKPV
jgi:flagellar protein FlgJ